MNGFVSWLMSPLSEWPTTSLQSKLLAGAVGAGLAYWLTKKKCPTWQVVLFSLLAAYGTSMVCNAASRFNALPALQTLPPMLPVVTNPGFAPPPPPSIVYGSTEPVKTDTEGDKQSLGDDQGIFG